MLNLELKPMALDELLAALRPSETLSVGRSDFDFSNRHFTEPVEIRGRHFSKTLRLDNSVFEQGLSITECTFAERLSATDISCNGRRADFGDCTFAGRVTVRPTATKLLSLRSGQFSNGFEIVVAPDAPMELDLTKSRIRGDAVVKSAHYEQPGDETPAEMGEFTLYESILEKEASLELGGLRLPLLHFSDMGVQDKASFYCVRVYAKTLWMQNLRITDKANISFHDVDFSGARMAGTNVEKFLFARMKWAYLAQRACLIDEIELREQLHKDCQALGNSQTAAQRDAVTENYRQLVMNHEAKRSYELAENFHVGEMEMARLAATASSRLGITLGRLNSFWLYRILSVYGTSYHRAVAVLCGLLLVFSALFLFNGMQVKETKRVINYEICWCLPVSLEEGKTAFKDSMAALGMTVSIATLQKERPLEPEGTTGSLLASALLLTASAQAALLLFALRRRFRRASI